MNSKAALLFILSFIFVYMWMPLHFDSDHFESRLSAEVRQVGSVLHKDLGDWVTRNALKLTSLKETTVFPESKLRDESEALFEEKRDNIWNIAYFQSLRALTQLAVFRLFIALVWGLVLLPAPLQCSLTASSKESSNLKPQLPRIRFYTKLRFRLRFI